MRGAAVDGNGVIADTLAGGFQLAVESLAGFENQNGGAGASGFFGKRPRGGATYFFIRIDLQDDFPGDRAVLFPQGPHRIDEKNQAGFHIEHTGAPKAALGLAEGHGAKGSDGPHGIGMAQYQNLLRLFRAGQQELAAQVLAGVDLNACDVFYSFDEELDEAPDGGGIVAGRFAFDELADGGDDLFLGVDHRS